MNDKKLISVIVPVYNSGQYLRTCLDSLSRQTYPNIEVILIDDGSADGSEKVCDEYAAADGRFKAVHKENGGVSSARNLGISIASGDFFHFLDSDDYIEPDTYEYCMALIEKHGCDAVNFEYYVSFPDHESTHFPDRLKTGLVTRNEAHIAVQSGEPFLWSKIFSRKLIKGDGESPQIGFNNGIYRGEDTLYVHLALERADSVWFDSRPLYHYVQSEESACRGSFRPSQLSALKLYDEYERYFSKYPEMMDLFYTNMAHILSGLYFDMRSDEKNYKKEEKEVLGAYRKHIRQALRGTDAKQKAKLVLFCVSPSAYCALHKKKTKS